MNPMRDINKHEVGCINKVGRATCGNTGLGGFVEVCSDCENKWNKRYPNGIPYSAEDDYDDGLN